jgi:two-component system sensor histidine kinase UhpB
MRTMVKPSTTQPNQPAITGLPGPAAERARPTRAPLDLPRLVMRRTSLVAIAVLAAALVLGLMRMGNDIDDEVEGATTLASLMASLGGMAQIDDRRALDDLRTLQRAAPLRHLVLRVRDSTGTLLLSPPAEPTVSPVLGWLLTVHSQLLPDRAGRQLAWAVPRPDGSRWTVSLAVSHESERREAMLNLVGTLLLLLACIAGLMLAVHWNVRRAFAPLGRLLDAIAGIELHNAQAVQLLPTMPIRELEAVAAALRQTGAALEAAENRRRLLAQQVLSLQEDERLRLARELHDEFGQRLTALRVDAAWLLRRVADQPPLRHVVEGMAEQCERVQQDIRALLTRLQPFGPLAEPGPGGVPVPGAESLHRLAALLQALVASWASPGREAAARCQLQLQWCAADGALRPWPQAAAAERLLMQRTLALALYRISQEALTNVARHAGARLATLSLVCHGEERPDAPLRIVWSASDDGVGTDERSLQRGNGLAGIQERVWALGADLRIGAALPGSRLPGLRLEAEFTTRLMGADAADEPAPHRVGDNLTQGLR